MLKRPISAKRLSQMPRSRKRFPRRPRSRRAAPRRRPRPSRCPKPASRRPGHAERSELAVEMADQPLVAREQPRHRFDRARRDAEDASGHVHGFAQRRRPAACARGGSRAATDRRGEAAVAERRGASRRRRAVRRPKVAAFRLEDASVARWGRAWLMRPSAGTGDRVGIARRGARAGLQRAREERIEERERERIGLLGFAQVDAVLLDDRARSGNSSTAPGPARAPVDEARQEPVRKRDIAARLESRTSARAPHQRLADRR